MQNNNHYGYDMTELIRWELTENSMNFSKLKIDQKVENKVIQQDLV